MNIPVPSFEFIHKKNNFLEKHDRYSEYLIGRDRIIERLRSWLGNKKKPNGSYLITGYRGMGKTCFVNKVLYELTRETELITNLIWYIVFASLIAMNCFQMAPGIKIFIFILTILSFLVLIRWYFIKELYYKKKFLHQVGEQSKAPGETGEKLKDIKSKEWDKISRFIYEGNIKNKSYQKISVNINLGQEILNEREILCVLTSQLYQKYKNYIFSPVSNFCIWILSAIVTTALSIYIGDVSKILPLYLPENFQDITNVSFIIAVSLLAFILFASYQLRILQKLNILRKRIDAALTYEMGLSTLYKRTTLNAKKSYSYAVASTREIELSLIDILERISRLPAHPYFYFVFDELDKIEVPNKTNHETQPEFSNEKHLPGGGTSRKRKTTVLHLLGNLKFFTSTAKAKFLFIAGREMYDAYLADMTDRESAISSLFNGVIYVESFCKNEKSEKDVMYNTETFIARQLIPHSHIEKKVIDRYIECKLHGKTYDYVDVNLKMYYEYLVMTYSNHYLSETPEETNMRVFNDAREAIDKAIILLYHFTFYLYHISNGSPKKMRMTFENYIRPIKDPTDFQFSKTGSDSPLDKADLDIHIPATCENLLSFGEKEQRVIGFIHYISFPVNQIFTDANQYGDKLLVSASFLINHIYKYHKGGFSWRNIEQTPELLEVYRIPEFRNFIESILTFLTQTHIIKIPCGLYQYKFRKHIAEEISLASKISEEISAIFNFTLDESQTVKRHYLEIQNNHAAILNEERIDSPHSISGMHHILGDLYMADEEYNNAIVEYQTALRELAKEGNSHDGANQEDSHEPTTMLAYIRYMLKLGMAYERRRTLSSAYNTYNEIIDRLFKFREFEEGKYGLKYRIQNTSEWPYHDAILYSKEEGVRKTGEERPIEPRILKEETELKELSYKTEGKHMMSDFSYLMTPEKHSVIQRLAMLEDTHMIYQALLAKLFVIEKIELGGITRANLDIAEGEYKFLHLATNEKEKFLISTDFFRRLGDIMYYKNGLLGFSINQIPQERDDNKGLWIRKLLSKVTRAHHHDMGCDKKDWKISESFADSLTYWGIDIKSEIHDYCQKHSCFEKYGEILKGMREWNPTNKVKDNSIPDSARFFFESDEFQIRWKELSISIDDVNACNLWRKEMWEKNRNLPCYACKYYNRSLRILMSKLFGINVEKEKNRRRSSGDNTRKSNSRSKTLVILKEIIKGGSSKSMRQNYMIQLAELLDCLGNTILSCADITKQEISSDFLAKFLHDVNVMNEHLDGEKDFEQFRLLKIEKLNKIETCILYYWEASVCFRYGNEQKKAAESIKMILRVIQNYLRISTYIKNKNKKEKDHGEPKIEFSVTNRKIVIGEFLNEIKNRLVKQSLICIYSHYNFINLMEIQRLKWIFYTQMYENISLSRLTLFPDVEEIMLVYYELIRLCVVTKEEEKDAQEKLDNTRKILKQIPEGIDKKGKAVEKQYTWSSIEKRNIDFRERLIGIYHNISMGSLSHHHTIYERILSLKFKTVLNQYILELIFPDIQMTSGHDQECIDQYIQIFCKFFTNNDLKKDSIANDKGEWKHFFQDISFNDREVGTEEFITCRIQVLEFLIKDSVYCLTEILETITPYTSTTLFTNSFMGDVYGNLHRWTILFDALFLYYKVFDENPSRKPINHETCFSNYDAKLEEMQKEKKVECECITQEHSSNENQPMQKPIYLEQIKDAENLKKLQKIWLSKCPFYSIQRCEHKTDNFKRVQDTVTKFLEERNIEKEDLYNLYK